jgi:signal transduction histidine kinase
MRVSPAVRVAAVATAALAGACIVGVIVLNVLVGQHLTGQVDERLESRLTAARHDPEVLSQRVARPGSQADIDSDGVPVFLWLADAAGKVTRHSPGAPARPPPQFRLQKIRYADGWLIAGQSLAGDTHTQHLLLDAELITGPFVLLAMFLGALLVGVRAQAPVEQSRRRQLEFTADASHELRTPLSVIRAEADVALSAPRSATEYRDALGRIQGESQRLRQLVDDMLWLARFDSRPPPPGSEPVDLATLAQACADRFRAVGPAVSAETPDGTVMSPVMSPVLISAPPEWIDRLAGVLVDNACRHAGPDGKVRIEVRAQGSRVSLTVEDSGPGIPEADRPLLFDRFHRAVQARGGDPPEPPAHGGEPSPPYPPGPGQHGAGLGLAIGDSIVRSTGGRWHIGDSPLGGALMSVSWRHSQPHRQ